MGEVWQGPRAESGSSPSVTENVARRSSAHRRPAPLALLLVAIAVVAAIVILLIVHERGTSSASLPTNGSPAVVSQAQLERLAASSSQPVYWAGPKSGYSYELTQTSSGRIFVRYLPSEVRPGDPRPDFLVVGTYTQPGSFADLQRAAKQPGALSLKIDNGGLVVFSSSKPTSVYLSYPGAKYQVEVYSPSGNTARTLVLAGKIKPVR